MLVLTSRYGEETALRALRYFASFAFNVSLFLERIPCAKLAKYRKARCVGWFLSSACAQRLFPQRGIIREPAVYPVADVLLNVRDDVRSNSRTVCLGFIKRLAGVR